ncbi:MAG: hypothetical protein FJ290_09600 [Planctomycetes bacterium]|nr:hypothetical protein [Planctomycetota bacterium]
MWNLASGIPLLLSLAAAAFAAGRPTISLDGAWQFRVDPNDAGEKEQWFDAKAPFKDTIQVPGAWDAQGFGAETPKLRHNFVGKGWYRRQVNIPAEWKGKRLFLTIGGIHRYAKVWVNGSCLGEHIGYLSPFEREITQHAKPGEAATIAICVDSKQRWDVDTLAGCFDIIDEMFTAWGGIWGHVAIEARGEAWLSDLFVQPQLDPPACIVSAKLNGKADGAKLELEILDAQGVRRSAAEASATESRTPQIRADIADAKLWSPSHPDLYTARLSLVRGEEVLDSVDARFGLRVIEIKGPHILLNGKRVFLHGYGDDCVYPETMAAPSDKAVYLKRLKLIKSYGFNYVRHHSHFLPPEYYEAADEVGMLISPELPIAYLNYYQRAKGPALDLYRQEWAAVIRRLRNHPCILDWCMGNEMWDGVPLAPELYRIAKDLDPTRPVIDSNGLSGGGWLDGKRDRPTLDFFVYMFDLGHTPLERPDRHRFGEPKKPVISHEMGNFITFPRLDQIEAFKHNFKPFWLTPAREKIEKLGLLGEAELWARNSERLYLLCHKLNIEDLRKNPFASGHQWWLFQDYWTGSNGIVDTYFRPKAEIPPERVRPFVGDVVLLLDGLLPVCRGGQALDLELLASNYSEGKLADAEFVVRASARSAQIRPEGRTAKPIAGCKGIVEYVTQGTVASIVITSFKLPDLQAPQMLTIEAELRAGDVRSKNEWTAWFYPAETAPPKLAMPLFAGPELVRALEWLGAKPLPGGEKLPAEAVYVMNQPTKRVLDAAAEGACLVMLSPQGFFPTERNRFKTGWWLGGPGDSNVGTVVYDNPITRAIAPDGWCDIGWHRLVEGSQAVILDNLPSQPEVLVRAIEVHRLCRSKALLFQAKVGKGSLIVSGLNLSSLVGGASLPRGPRDGDVPPTAPEAEWLLARMVEHAGTLPKPKGELPLDFLRQRVAAMEPPEGPFISGFQRIVRNEGETDRWVSIREDNATYHICRQTAPGHLVEWETAHLPADWKGATATFVFAGGIGFVSQPRTKGFALLVNGKEALAFDVTQDRSVWKSADKRVALHFVPMRAMPQDGIGLFYVAVAADLLTPDKPCTFGVRSNGSGSRRWFGLNPYADVAGGR